MSAKEYLAAKIDNEAAFNAIIDKLGYPSIPNRWGQANRVPNINGDIYNKPWWLVREVLRLNNGVYRTTEVIDNINQSWAAPMTLHISSDDDKMVAYTPSTEDGARDKQIKTTLGRFLRKHFITLTDAQIQQLEQSHTAELTAEFLLAQTRDEIRKVYTGLVGDSGCMRHQPLYFNIGNNIHPSAVYEAPGMGVAYTADAEGNIRSRAVVWVNPEDENDKRYVRVYGAPVLRKILENKGYTCSSLEGAKLRKIPFVHRHEGPRDNLYVMPYLDGPDGQQGHRDGAHVVDEGDAEFFRLLTATERDAISRAMQGRDSYTPLCKTTSATIHVERLPSVEFVSDKTGKTHSIFTTTKVFYLKDDKTVGVCAKDELEAPWAMYELRTTYDGQTTVVMCPQGTPTFVYGGRSWLDNEKNRLDRGYVRLSEKYYESSPWIEYSKVNNIEVDGVVHSIKVEDVRFTLPATGEAIVSVHVSEVAALRKQGYINCSPLHEHSTLIHKLRPTMRRTIGGTVFDSVFHSDRFAELVTGEWVLKTSAVMHRLFGQRFYTARGASTHWTSGIPTQSIVDAIKKTSFGVRTIRTMDNLAFDGLHSTGVAGIKESIEQSASEAMENYCGLTWKLTTDDNGVKSISQYASGRAASWNDHVTLLRFMETNDLSDHYDGSDAIPLFMACAKAMEVFLTDYLTKLTALFDQKKMEEAGQMRIDEIAAAAAVEPEPVVSTDPFAFELLAA